MSPRQVKHIIISSVVPPVESHIAASVRKLFPHWSRCSSSRASRPECRCSSTIQPNLARTGFATAIAAYERYGGPCIVVDFGTATKFEVISERGEYLGGAIAPGLGISADALFSRAARLSRVDIKRPAKVIGTNTTVAICRAASTTATSDSWMEFSSAFSQNWA